MWLTNIWPNNNLLHVQVYLSSPLVFSGVRVARFLVFYVMFCRSLFVLFSLGHGVVSFFDLRLLITPLVVSNFPCVHVCLFILYTYPCVFQKQKTLILNMDLLTQVLLFSGFLSIHWLHYHIQSFTLHYTILCDLNIYSVNQKYFSKSKTFGK